VELNKAICKNGRSINAGIRNMEQALEIIQKVDNDGDWHFKI